MGTTKSYKRSNKRSYTPQPHIPTISETRAAVVMKEYEQVSYSDKLNYVYNLGVTAHKNMKIAHVEGHILRIQEIERNRLYS